MTDAVIDHGGITSAVPGYRLGEVLRADAVGHVVLAEDLANNRAVELRLIAPELGAIPGFAKRFRHETQKAGSFHHRNLLPVYEVGEHAGALFVATRSVGAVPLSELVGQGAALERRRVMSILSQAAAALDSAHGRGLVHRGVNPGTLLVVNRGDEDHLYVTDFGVVAPPETQSGLIGPEPGLTPLALGYAAPEQIAGDPVGGRADVYAVGCVAFRMLAGEEPFGDEHSHAELEARLTSPPPSARAVDESLPTDADQVIATAMATDPASRYPTVGEFVAALEPTLASRPDSGDGASAALSGAPGRAEPVPEPKAVAESELAEAGPPAQPEAESAPADEPEPETPTEAESAPAEAPQPEAPAPSEAEPEVEAQAEAEAEVEAEVEPEAEADAEVEPEAEAEPAGEPEPAAEAAQGDQPPHRGMSGFLLRIGRRPGSPGMRPSPPGTEDEETAPASTAPQTDGDLPAETGLPPAVETASEATEAESKDGLAAPGMHAELPLRAPRPRDNDRLRQLAAVGAAVLAVAAFGGYLLGRSGDSPPKEPSSDAPLSSAEAGSSGFDVRLARTLTTLNGQRSRLRARLRGAKTSGAQARTADNLASAHDAAARSLGSTPRGRPAEIRSALTDTGAAYGRLAAAARRNNARGYSAASGAVDRQEGRLRSALRSR